MSVLGEKRELHWTLAGRIDVRKVRVTAWRGWHASSTYLHTYTNSAKLTIFQNYTHTKWVYWIYESLRCRILTLLEHFVLMLHWSHFLIYCAIRTPIYIDKNWFSWLHALWSHTSDGLLNLPGQNFLSNSGPTIQVFFESYKLICCTAALQI